MRFLLDTNVVSEVRKTGGNEHVLAWFASVSGAQLHLSVLVLGEIRQGIERLRRRRDAAQAHRLETWLSTLTRDYSDRIIPVTAQVADAWGRLNVPDPLPVVDGLLAATAEVHGLILVTRNTGDLARTGLPLLNPFEPDA
jgi:toxin FitB